MDFQAYNKILICKDDMQNLDADGVVTGYSFNIKYPSYRGAFLSCIEDLKFWVDGEEISGVDVTLTINGKQFLMSELSECFKEYWYVNHKGAVTVDKLGGIAPGEHSVRVYMRHRVPYTGYFGEYLTLDSDMTDTLTAK